MHAISSYRGNRPTHTHTNKYTHGQDRLQYTAPLNLARSVINVLYTLYSVELADPRITDAIELRLHFLVIRYSFPFFVNLALAGLS